jgi:dTDP-4-dehydrorhamnose reductase
MRILLLGKDGQLGWELQRTLATLGETVALDFPDIDLTQETQTRERVRGIRPEIIVNTSAYTAVDQAESEPEIASLVNGQAPGWLAQEALALNCALIHYSTDYVFDGQKGEPYLETDQPNPLGIYGQSKLEGELAVQEAGGAYLIIRTSWVYSLRRESFVTKVLRWSRQQTRLRVVSDQVSNPTWCRMLAEVTGQLLGAGLPHPHGYIKERRGIYHAAGDGHASRLDWARAILEYDPQQGQQTAKEVLPALTSDFPTPARRPLYSALNCDRFLITFGLQLPHWLGALQMALESRQ